MTATKGRGKTALDVEALLDGAAKLGCSQAEVYEAGNVRTPVNFENNKLKSVETVETSVVAVRVVRNGRLGFATSTRPGDAGVVEMAARAADFGPEAEFDFAPPAPVAPDLKTYDQAVADWPADTMVAAGEGLVETIKTLGEGVLAGVSVEKQSGYRRVATSAGQNVYSASTGATVLGVAELVEPENMIAVYDFAASRRLDLDFEAVGRRIGWLYRQARHNVPMRGGSYPVIFSPMAGADLISPMVACLNGEAVVKGESPWKSAVGQKLFADGFTLRDDPAIPWGPNTTPFDDEGTPTKGRTVIGTGVLREFNLDLRSARALGKVSTGSGFKPGSAAAPAPCPTNLVLEPGHTPLASLIAGIKEGLYIGRLMGAWAGNPYTGQISGNIVLGFRIENGEIMGRVKDCMLAANVFEAFRHHLLALSQETEFTASASRLPYILLDKVSVSTKG